LKTGAGRTDKSMHSCARKAREMCNVFEMGMAVANRPERRMYFVARFLFPVAVSRVPPGRTARTAVGTPGDGSGGSGGPRVGTG
jgi:hypothetical protein